MEITLQRYLDGQATLKDALGISTEYLSQLRGRAQYYVDAGQWERALIMLDMVAALDRSDSAAELLAAEVELRMGRSFAAESRIRAVLESQPDSVDAHLASAAVYMARANLTDARACVGRASEHGRAQGQADEDPAMRRLRAVSERLGMPPARSCAITRPGACSPTPAVARA
jgi:predicted Zn-dependent protease